MLRTSLNTPDSCILPQRRHHVYQCFYTFIIWNLLDCTTLGNLLWQKAPNQQRRRGLKCQQINYVLFRNCLCFSCCIPKASWLVSGSAVSLLADSTFCLGLSFSSSELLFCVKFTHVHVCSCCLRAKFLPASLPYRRNDKPSSKWQNASVICDTKT